MGKLNRRTILRGAGVALALPFLESRASTKPAAFPRRRIVAINGLLLLGFGPRTPEAVAELAEALHPGLEVSRR